MEQTSIEWLVEQIYSAHGIKVHIDIVEAAKKMQEDETQEAIIDFIASRTTTHALVTKPIHKFNGGKGATLCHECRVIISEGHTQDFFCEKCKF